MFSKWIDESEFDGKNDFFDNSVMSVRQWLAVLVGDDYSGGECRDDFLVGFCREGTHQLQQGELGTGLGHPAYGIRHSRSPAGRNPVVRVVYT